MVVTVFFGQCPAKTFVFTQFSPCCKKYFFHAKGTKTLCFGSWHAPKKQQKVPNMASKKHLVILSSFFDPQKRQNTAELKDFGISSAGGHAKARLQTTTQTAASPDFLGHHSQTPRNVSSKRSTQRTASSGRGGSSRRSRDVGHAQG